MYTRNKNKEPGVARGTVEFKKIKFKKAFVKGSLKKSQPIRSSRLAGYSWTKGVIGIHIVLIWIL